MAWKSFVRLKKPSLNKIKSPHELSNDWVHLHEKPKYEEYLKINISQIEIFKLGNILGT